MLSPEGAKTAMGVEEERGWVFLLDFPILARGVRRRSRAEFTLRGSGQRFDSINLFSNKTVPISVPAPELPSPWQLMEGRCRAVLKSSGSRSLGIMQGTQLAALFYLHFLLCKQ